MKDVLNRLIAHQTISTEEAKQIIVNISNDMYNSSQIACFLSVYMMRSITIEELQGFRDALLELCIPIDLSEYNAIDIVGTGGDGKNTFNISTLSSFITAGAGIHVSKHGNYGVSSTSGSSNVMEYLGVKFSNDEAFLKRCLDKAGICILHAPLFHPAMKNVAPIRKELGVKTFFNMLGPMVNPSFPKNQLLGVYSLEILRLYSFLYQKTDKNYNIVYALDGYDEISLTGKAKLISNHSETLFSPQDLNLKTIKPSEIFGGETIKEAANLFVNIIDGNGTEAQNNVVCANAGLAIATSRQITHIEGFELAKESLLSGKAKQSLNKLIELSK
ncbi:anthranilate phosphoribosyltransferase [Winogradskyella sp. PC-19]|uniref:anthranilate phosphoribosyltransferase n=1 Tax=unclassified Winogradskyella TaxID=2615021 RepID=UPI000B3C1F21|nr:MULTISPECIES: anthranilate phosphoribosyltransferase [unclassified Winogradskyella]ARV10365.1 anthranilate phosphoribosyltransferase [Winogradskyella sp. PC-19]RZN82937.1 MAG: anthranilate phosphoribosyltransferase [Winogradskyella sp.]